MKVHQLMGPPAPALAEALAEFEKPFTYPLGPGRTFRISHGEDYTLFFRSQGTGACFVAEQDGQVAGALGTAIRRLIMPDGTECRAAYFGDLKIAAAARCGSVLIRLARTAEAWLRPQVSVGFGIVMGGTSLNPEAYTGRAGIPGFEEVGRVAALRIHGGEPGQVPERFVSDSATGKAAYRRLASGRYACPVGKEAEQRSEIGTTWLANPDNSACGMLEDTRKAKRLIISDGSEMLSAHLSCFAYDSVTAGAELIDVALRHALSLNFPALFVSVVEQDAPAFQAALRGLEVVVAPAVVYGTGLPIGNWNINTAEI
jgi:hypothetical protein